RSRTTPAAAERAAPDGPAGADASPAVQTEPAEGLATQVWGMVKRARLVIVIGIVITQAVLALISWRIKRRSGRATEQEALEAFGEKLGGIAGTIDASSED